MLSLIFCFASAVGNIWYGMYGLPSNLGWLTMCLIVLQLLGAGIIIILIDDMLKSGYGLGSGISLFIMISTSEVIFWHMLSPVTLASEYGVEFEGCLICLIHFILTKKQTSKAIFDAFTRNSGPNLSSFLGTILIFLIVVYLSKFRKKITFTHQKHRGYTYDHYIRLFYTSSMGVILQSMFVSNIHQLSRLLHMRFSKSTLIHWFGTWQGNTCVGGFAYYISPPEDFSGIVHQPLQFFSYVVFICTCSALFSR